MAGTCVDVLVGGVCEVLVPAGDVDEVGGAAVVVWAAVVVGPALRVEVPVLLVEEGVVAVVLVGAVADADVPVALVELVVLVVAGGTGAPGVGGSVEVP